MDHYLLRRPVLLPIHLTAKTNQSLQPGFITNEQMNLRNRFLDLESSSG